MTSNSPINDARAALHLIKSRLHLLKLELGTLKIVELSLDKALYFIDEANDATRSKRGAWRILAKTREDSPLKPYIKETWAKVLSARYGMLLRELAQEYNILARIQEEGSDPDGLQDAKVMELEFLIDDKLKGRVPDGRRLASKGKNLVKFSPEWHYAKYVKREKSLGRTPKPYEKWGVADKPKESK